MNDRRAPASAAPSRRGFLVVGGVVVVAAAGGGVALGLSQTTSPAGPLVATVPTELAAAASAERALLTTLDAAIRTARGQVRTELRLIRADHAAHLAAIDASIVQVVYPAVRPSGPASSASAAPPSAGVDRSTVRRREQAAAQAAAARALRLSGDQAVLLASIAASEATHAELLS